MSSQGQSIDNRDSIITTLRADLARVTGEVTRLTDCLNGANANHEEFERKWYLATHENEDLRARIATLEGERDQLKAANSRLATIANDQCDKTMSATRITNLEVQLCNSERRNEIEKTAYLAASKKHREKVKTLEAGIAERDAAIEKADGELESITPGDYRSVRRIKEAREALAQCREEGSK